MTTPAFIRLCVLPHIGVEPYVETAQSVMASIPVRSIVAPANRAPIESPANRSGFSEKLK